MKGTNLKLRQLINESVEDIDIMGQKFNFHDICPTAHKTVGDLAKEYKNDQGKLGDLLVIANAHQAFFALEKKALATKKLSDDEVNDLKRLYTEITNMAFNTFGGEVGGDISEYMNMHMETVEKAIGDFYNVGLEENNKVRELIRETIFDVMTEGLCPKGKAYIAKRKRAGEKSSAYLSGRAVKVCKGQMKG